MPEKIRQPDTDFALSAGYFVIEADIPGVTELEDPEALRCLIAAMSDTASAGTRIALEFRLASA